MTDERTSTPHSPSASSSITPVPSIEEAVAIAAAVEALWPRVVTAAEPDNRSTAWRFSGRWWARPHIQRRVRP